MIRYALACDKGHAFARVYNKTHQRRIQLTENPPAYLSYYENHFEVTRFTAASRPAMPPLNAFLTTRVTRGLRLPRSSMVIRPAPSSLRSARLFASGCTP